MQYTLLSINKIKAIMKRDYTVNSRLHYVSENGFSSLTKKRDSKRIVLPVSIQYGEIKEDDKLVFLDVAGNVLDNIPDLFHNDFKIRRFNENLKKIKHKEKLANNFGIFLDLKSSKLFSADVMDNVELIIVLK